MRETLGSSVLIVTFKPAAIMRGKGCDGSDLTTPD